MKTTLVLIRHGETEWTREKRYCGSNDIPLNSTGRRQARLTGRSLRGMEFDAAYCSDLRRCRGFAALALKGKDVRSHSGLREMDFGIFEGLTHDELLKKHPSLYPSWLKDFRGVTPPGAERFTDFRRRVTKAFREIIAANRGKTCVIVSHGGVMMAFFSSITGNGKLWRLLPSLAGVSRVEIEGKKMKLVSFNDTRHLEENGKTHLHNRRLQKR